MTMNSPLAVPALNLQALTHTLGVAPRTPGVQGLGARADTGSNTEAVNLLEMTRS